MSIDSNKLKISEIKQFIHYDPKTGRNILDVLLQIISVLEIHDIKIASKLSEWGVKLSDDLYYAAPETYFKYWQYLGNKLHEVIPLDAAYASEIQNIISNKN